MAIAQVNAPVILIGTDGKRFLLGLRPGQQFHTHRGIIEHDALIGQPLGREIRTHLGHPFVALQPSLYDLLMDVKRASQIIYPKDIGMILLKLNVGPGQCIVEAGTGSGALTLALAHASQPDGVVYSYDSRDDMLRVAEGNLERVGLLERVRLTQRDISQGLMRRTSTPCSWTCASRGTISTRRWRRCAMGGSLGRWCPPPTR